MLEFLPEKIRQALQTVNMRLVYELRLRADKPVAVNYGGKYRFLRDSGVSDKMSSAITVTREEIADAVFSAGKFSVYSVEEQIKRGFITAEGGARIGLAGHYTFENGKPLSIRNFTSLCIRIPHEVIGCGEEIYRACCADGVKSLLLMSPPGIGKTTILRDLSRLISKNTAKNILVCDERGELSAGDVGATGDVLLFADKATAFEAGIRAMRPDVMITDELSPEDCASVRSAVYGGVKVLASAHFSDISAVQPPFTGLFERYILLDAEQIGKVKEIYGKDLKPLSGRS